MGATTYNDELKIELVILDDLLNQKLPAPLIQHVKHALMTGAMPASDADDKERRLTKIYLTLPELVHNDEPLAAHKKIFYEAKFYFLRRRFVEAAKLFTAVLQYDPLWVEARNYRARAIFFLGNPDKAIRELKLIINQYGESSPSGVDALYLIGAIVFESNDRDHARLANGIDAWTRYAKLAQAPAELKKEVDDGLAELVARQKGEPDKTMREAILFDPFSPNPSYSKEKNAILTAFAKEEMLLSLKLAEDYLKNNKETDPDIATVKARILFKTGRLDEASEDFVKLITNHKTYAPGFHYQGMTFMLKGEPERAIEAWQHVVKINHNYARAHNLEQRIATAKRMVSE